MHRGTWLGVDPDIVVGEDFSSLTQREDAAPPRLGNSAWRVHTAQDGNPALYEDRKGSRPRGHGEGCMAGWGCSQSRGALNWQLRLVSLPVFPP